MDAIPINEEVVNVRGALAMVLAHTIVTTLEPEDREYAIKKINDTMRYLFKVHDKIEQELHPAGHA